MTVRKIERDRRERREERKKDERGIEYECVCPRQIGI